MDTKHQVLVEKLNVLIQKIDEHKATDEYAQKFLNINRERAKTFIQLIKENKLAASSGGLLGFIRGLGENEELCNDDELFDAAEAVDVYYGDECTTWEDTPKKTESEVGGFSVV